MYIYVYIHMYIQSIYRWVCAYMHTYTHMYLHMYMSIHIYTCGCVGVCLCAYLLRSTVQYNSESHTQFQKFRLGRDDWQLAFSFFINTLSEFLLPQYTGKHETCFIPNHHGQQIMVLMACDRMSFLIFISLFEEMSCVGSKLPMEDARQIQTYPEPEGHMRLPVYLHVLVQGRRQRHCGLADHFPLPPKAFIL